MKTVREVAEQLNISRQAVYSKLTTDFKANFTTTEIINGRPTLVISSVGVDKLNQDIDKVNSQVDSQVDNLLDNEIDKEIIKLLTENIETLQEQLKIKDTQISELNERLREQQELNRNNQFLLLKEQERKAIIGLEEGKGEGKDKTILEKIKGFFNKE